MGRIFKKREKTYAPVKDDTLDKIVSEQCENGVTWQELAIFNWGTVEKDEVNRALIETIGCSKAEDRPNESKLDPALGPEGSGKKIYIPEVWRSGDLAPVRGHTVKVKRILPAPAVRIIKLDKWFIPKKEACEIKYALEGLKECADKVQMDVFGSNYCDCTDWKKGLGTYGDPAALADEPIYTKDLASQADERREYDLPDGGWKGDATTAKGMLGRKTGTATARHINVAFSPYTVHFRYWKDEGDKNARVSLAPFWPRWKEEKAEPAATGSDSGATVKVRWTNAAKADRGVLEIRDRNEQLVHLAEIPEGKLAAGSQDYDWDKKYREDVLNSKFERKYLDDSGETAPENAPYSYKVTTFVLKLDDQSLKIKWSIKNATDLENGMIEIVDGSDKRVFLKALPKGKLSAGNKDIDWDGKYTPGVTNSDGKEEITPKDMPYRVQIQAHRAPDKEKGLALAAMHTEVRLFVHPKTHLPKDPAYDPLKAEASLVLGLGPLAPGTPPGEGDGIKWYQYRLAECGFHPGPVNGTDGDEFKVAMREFQRSVPKKKTGAKYERLTVTGAMSADTKDAIKAMTDGHRRPWFGNPDDDKKDLDHKDEAGKNAINERLKDRSKDLMVWVDARHYYTHTDNVNNQPLITGTIGDYHGDMEVGDKLVEDYDGKIIPRPWIPLQADLGLLGKSKTLKDEDPGLADEETRKAMRRALGPIRVDWTFDEIGPDLSPIDTTKYDAARVRTLEYVGWALNKYKKNHVRKDTGRKAFYTNCPGGPDPDDLSGADNFGGIRPDNLDNYYKKVFGFDDGTKDFSLAPWRASPLDASQSIATVLHDHLSVAQRDQASNLFEPLIGMSGIYFRPSRVAGDGFRLRAEVQFTKYTDYEFPNLEVLAARYPLLPQAHTAKFRLWRKSSIRGYLRWTTRNNIGHITGLRESYHAAHFHFADEKREATVPTYRPSDLVNAGDVTDYDSYKTIIADRVSQNYHRNNRGLMRLDDDHSFPWYNEGNLGWPWPSEPNVAFGKVSDLVEEVEGDTWSRIQEGIILNMVKRIEEKDGRLRGHLLAHFLDTETAYAERYVCKTCNKKYWYLEKDAAGGANDNKSCPCGGHVRRTGTCTGRYMCANGHGPFNGANDTFPGGGKYNGRQCPTCHDPSLACASTVQTEAREAPRRVPTGTRTIVSYGIGDAGGATWLLKDFKAWEWAHEVGHHRHFEHAADAPVGDRNAEKDKLHDSQRNTGVNWSAQGVTSVLNRRWDRCCTMSYVDSSSGYSDPDAGGVDHTYFCGKCVLRNRGWKVEGIPKGPAIAPDLPEIESAPVSRDWGDVGVGKHKDHILTISNPGAARLEVSKTEIGGDDPGEFAIQSGGGAFNVDSGGTHDIEIRFEPTAAENYAATLTLSSNVDPSAFPGRNPLNIELKGAGKDLPDIEAAPASHNFGNVASGAHGDITITVTNSGTAALNVTATNIAGDGFAIQSGGGAFNLDAGLTRDIVVRFTPASDGHKAGTISLVNNVAGKSPLTVNLEGTGTP